MTRILTVVGARPQFIKAAAVSREIASRRDASLVEVMVHTGQHHDGNMSQVFFDELGIPAPAYNLAIAGGGHGDMTGRMMQALEPVVQKERPDWLLIYGDTNSTLAGALVAAKLHVPVAHVEAGLRSFNMRMPEEVNRILSDRVSSQLFCPTEVAVTNLAREGITEGVKLVGDVMYDVALHHGAVARRDSQILNRLGLAAGRYVLVTCHRAENTDDPLRLGGIFQALDALARVRSVVVPLHPRTRKVAQAAGLLDLLAKCHVIEPVSYLDMVAMEQDATVIVTDSGGVQKEAFFFGVPCVTVRDQTEWTETVDLGWNRLVPAQAEAIVAAVQSAGRPLQGPDAVQPYGDGHSARRIVDALQRLQPLN